MNFDNKLNFTFLTEEQSFGERSLDILKKYGTTCDITDFSVLLGGFPYAKGFHNGEGIFKKDQVGYWWTKSCNENNLVVAIDSFGFMDFIDSFYRRVGSRPALPYSSISSICSNIAINKEGILEVEYGEYPQTIVSRNDEAILENAYLNKTINQTSKSYTSDFGRYLGLHAPFQVMTHIEYEYNGKKYIRLVGDKENTFNTLSNGVPIQDDYTYWIEVEPIKWMVDEKANIALSKKILFTGVLYDKENNCKGDFSKTNIKKFLDTYFSKEIVPINSKELILQEKNLEEGQKKLKKIRKPYGLI